MKYRICWKMIFHIFVQKEEIVVFIREMGKE